MIFAKLSILDIYRGPGYASDCYELYGWKTEASSEAFQTSKTDGVNC